MTTLIIFFIIGLATGSFLNVLVYRLRTAEEIFWSRSKCPHCQKGIAWYDNVPVLSFVLLRFRCRKCKQKISWQYPLVEIGTALIFVLMGSKFFVPADPTTWVETFFYLAISCVFISILVYDWLYLEIPGIILWPAVGFSAGFVLFSDWSRPGFGDYVWNVASFSGLAGAFFGFLFFFILSSVSREKWMGMGDAYLMILLGLVLGFGGTLLAVFLAFCVGAICGIILIALKKKKMKSQLPFAPFLVLGSFVSILFYRQISEFYFSLFIF